MNLDQREQKIIQIFLKSGKLQSSDVNQELSDLGDKVSPVTVKRVLSGMVDKGVLKVGGSGRSTSYELTISGRLFADVDVEEYFSYEIDKRYGLKNYNFDIFQNFREDIFTDDEMSILSSATDEYKRRIKDITPAIEKKELERLVIELSWKSSEIEGNTYTLLDTENLLLNGIPGEGKTKEETQMILNHKEAFDFVYNNQEIFKNLTPKNLEELHKIIVKDLNINSGFRKNPVGISGSIYQPLDNVYQIKEAIDNLSKVVGSMRDVYSQAFLALVGISYIQPFEDGNKRISRIMADALLLSGNLAPLSYRSVDTGGYKKAMLVFYELNSIVPFKKIFIEQYDFAARNYAVK